jgi:large subunit ribosomal protein L11
MEQAIKVSEMKKDSLMGKDQKNRAKEVIGTCVSCGITVEGKEPRDILKEIDEGKWDAKFAA